MRSGLGPRTLRGRSRCVRTIGIRAPISIRSKRSPIGGLHDLTVVELQEMAKAKGVTLNMTTQDVINLLDELEPGGDHKAL
jgi:hypothetical protein